MLVICLCLSKFLDIPLRAVPTASRDAGRAASDAFLGKQSRRTSLCRPGSGAHHQTTPPPPVNEKRPQPGAHAGGSCDISSVGLVPCFSKPRRVRGSQCETALGARADVLSPTSELALNPPNSIRDQRSTFPSH